MKYAEYVCGEFSCIVSEFDMIQNPSDMVDYVPLWNGIIYPSLSENAITQIELFGKVIY